MQWGKPHDPHDPYDAVNSARRRAMKQRTRQYQQPSTRVTWAIGILAAPSEKYGRVMKLLAMRCLHRRDSGHRLHDSAQCDLCIPPTKYFTPSQPVATPAAKPTAPGRIAVAPVTAAPPPAPIPIPTPVPTPVQTPVQTPVRPGSTYKGLSGLDQILRSPSSDERHQQPSHRKGEF
jgi:hypothetical protein